MSKVTSIRSSAVITVTETMTGNGREVYVYLIDGSMWRLRDNTITADLLLNGSAPSLLEVVPYDGAMEAS